MPPHLRAVPGQNAPQQMMQQDERIAAALQAQEYHRSLHPSRAAASAHLAAGGGHGAHGNGLGALGALAMGAGSSSGGGRHDPEREARHKARDEQLKMALEVNPEAFVSVPMLYVQCLLNNPPVKAFVDTGAQSERRPS